MLQKYLDKLEYNQILKKIADYCSTYIGKDLALAFVPSYDKDTVEFSLAQTKEAVSLIFRKGSPAIISIADIKYYIKNLRSYNSLSAKALLDVANVLKTSRMLNEYFFGDETFDLSDYTTLEPLFSSLYSNLNVEKRIFDAIMDEDTIADDASTTLSSLRRNRKKLEQSVREKLTNFIHSSTYSKFLMDSIITIRNDRFVIPVKEEFKSQISGSILDVSSSGSTVYIEPSSVFELNNKINNLKAEEALEIEKILKNLSLALFPLADKLETSVITIGNIDLIFAKAKYSKEINGICPKINSEKYISLISARHPLIDPEKIVPIDVSIGINYRSLLITGPNTGGKTVTLKTVGLLCLMAFSGILIPAKENSSIYLFDNIFADIGDEQSIQESLSTFSAHMMNIIDILHIATSNSLILLDELGSGTDPVEGASLAISILEHFYNLGAITFCTTHYPELKRYALVTDGFENASSDFDVENLIPTYKLLIGVPGKSNAFAISKKLGLDNQILSRASAFLKKDDINIETLLKNIYDDKLAIEKEKEEIEKNSNQIQLLRVSLERDNSKLNKEADSIIANAKIKARDILLDAKDEANEIIKELNNSSTDAKKANIIRNKLNDSINSLAELNSNVSSNQLLEDELFVGQEVLYKKLNLTGTILSMPNQSNEVKLQVGAMTVNSKISDLEKTHTSTPTKKSTSSVSFSNSKAKTVTSELNVIGLNVDQAIPIVDKYLDDCSMAGLEQARIVHGKGTGKLRTGIHTFLKKQPHVKSFRLGTFGEGEMGVTVVYLK